MFQTLKNAWMIPELRKKILYTLLLLVIFRLGSVIPVPFISPAALAEIIGVGTGTLFDYLNTFSGGAFAEASIFAMSISPYITASIIMNLLTVAIPALERLQKQGEDGRKKIKTYTRFLTITLGAIQATGLYFGLRGAVTQTGFIQYLVIAFTFTAGTAFLMWLGEQISEKGIGNGISMIIFAGIISMLPDAIIGFGEGLISGTIAWYVIAIIIALSLLIIAAVVFMTESERRIQVQYAKRVVGRKMYGGQSTHIPIKLLAAGVIPIIFASSIMMFPATIAQFFGKTVETTTGFWRMMLQALSPSSWFYALIYFVLILFFTYFYTAIQFNPIEIANRIKNDGGSVPGLRQGKPTSDYITKVLSRVTLAGAIFLALMAVLPILIMAVLPLISGGGVPMNIGIGGTSLLIVVGVALETTKQLESHMLTRHYKGFLE